MPLNPRQLAIAIWLCVLLVFCLSKGDIRRSVLRVVRCVLEPTLFITALLSLAWVVGVVFALSWLGLWSLPLLWDSVAFAVIGTATLIRKMVESKDYSSRFYGRVVLQSLGLSALVSTLASTYTFGLVLELVLVPWLVILGAMLGVTQASDQYASLRKPVEVLIGLTGAAMLVQAVYGAVLDYRGFLSILTVQSLLLVFALTAAYVPYLYGLRVWMVYESALVPLRLGEEKRLSVRFYARAKVALRFRLHLSRVEHFGKGAANGLSRCATRADVDAVLEGGRAED